MQIVIDIPEEHYKQICENKEDSIIAHDTCRRITHGIPLPKGHGRLGDLDELEKLCIEHNIANSAYDNSPMIEQGHYSDGDCIWKPLFDFAPAIIEADIKEDE